MATRWWQRRGVRVGLAVLVVLATGVTMIGAAVYGIDPLELLLTRDDDGCPHQVGPRLVSADWAGDFLQYEGGRYWRLDAGTVGADQVGEQVTTIRCTAGEEIASAVHLRDDHALFLAVGTPLHRLVDTDPGFRLVAVEDGARAVYEVDRVPGASTGAALLAVDASRVDQVGFRIGGDEVTVDDPDTIAAIVGDLQAANAEADWAGPTTNGEVGTIRLALRDQPPKVLDVWLDDARTFDGLHVPPEVLARFP